jgi:predicted DNA-binding antitoxin AbrB/MazE fold protein
MAEIVTAVYEKGILRPLQPLKLRESQRVRIQVLPEELSTREEWETMVQALRQARLTSPLADTLLQQAAPVSPARRAELAQALAVGKPLSEIVIEERAERW